MTYRNKAAVCKGLQQTVNYHERDKEKGIMVSSLDSEPGKYMSISGKIPTFEMTGAIDPSPVLDQVDYYLVMSLIDS